MTATDPLPYPTPTRLRLAAGIAAGQVKHHAFARPQSFWRRGLDEARVTADLAQLTQAGLAELGEPTDDGGRVCTVTLTALGRAWRVRGTEHPLTAEGVRGALDMLGGTGAEVADTLRAGRWLGHYGRSCDCPVAVCLRAVLPGAGHVGIGLELARVYSTPEAMGTPLSVPLPQPVRAFVDEFDGRDGRAPGHLDLIAETTQIGEEST